MTKNEESWPSIKRALIILHQLQKEPATKKELMQAVREAIPDAYNQKTESSQRRSFERDIDNLRNRLNVNIPPWDRSSGMYYLLDSGPYAKFNLSKDVLTSIAFLLETFGPDSGAHEIMQPLLSFLENNLTSEQLRRLDRQSDPLRIVQMILMNWDTLSLKTSKENQMRIMISVRLECI